MAHVLDGNFKIARHTVATSLDKSFEGTRFQQKPSGIALNSARDLDVFVTRVLCAGCLSAHNPGGHTLSLRRCANKLRTWYYMSLGYAQKLSYKEDLGGSFGKPEVVEPSKELLRKALLLADWVSGPEHLASRGLPVQLKLLWTANELVLRADQRGKERRRVYWCWHLDELWHTRLQVPACSTGLTGSGLGS